MTGPSPGPELELEVPAKPEFVRTVRHTVGALAVVHGVPEDVVEDVKLAVSEACTTAMEATVEAARGAGGETEPLVVRATADRDRVEVEVLDRGAGPGREVAGHPGDLHTEDLPFGRALSVPLIRGLVDELEISTREGGGSVIRMRLLGPGQPPA
jgi:serine/threonine-protein kinase RsbW